MTAASYIEDALTDDEAAEGLALACQMRPKSDLVLDIAASSEVCKTKGQTFQAQVRIGGPAVATRQSPFRWNGMGPLTFLPGQYVNVLVPGHRSAAVLFVQFAAGCGYGVVPRARHRTRA